MEEEEEEVIAWIALLQSDLDAPGLDHSSQRVAAIRISIRALAAKRLRKAGAANEHLKEGDKGRAAPSS